MTGCCSMEKTNQENAKVEPLRSGGTYRPAIDIVEKENELLLIADVPGADADTIDIRFDRGELTLCARVAPRTREGAKPLLAEYGVGDFCRTFSIAEEIDAKQITAATRNGVLTVHLPKRESTKPRRIPVSGV